MRVKCPYCSKHIETPNVLEENVENYGSGTFHIRCPKCNEMIGILAGRKVYIVNVYKSSVKEQSW